MDIDFVKETCKISQNAKCCRYLVMGSGGFQCVKGELVTKERIDNRVAQGQMVAQGDNCDGISLT